VSVALAPTHAFVLRVPVLLLALDGAVARVPAAVIHRLLLTIVTLQVIKTNNVDITTASNQNKPW